MTHICTFFTYIWYYFNCICEILSRKPSQVHWLTQRDILGFHSADNSSPVLSQLWCDKLFNWGADTIQGSYIIILSILIAQLHNFVWLLLINIWVCYIIKLMYCLIINFLNKFLGIWNVKNLTGNYVYIVLIGHFKFIGNYIFNH